jgi:hypothetical protein
MKITTIHSKVFETIHNELSTHPYECLKIIIIGLKAHTKKKGEK